MKKILSYTMLFGLVLFLLAGCPSPLNTNLLSDLVITLGRFNPTANNILYGATSGTLSVPVTISDQTGRSASGVYDVAFTLSIDPDLSTTGDNTSLGTASVTAGSEQIVDLSVPATVLGNYTLFAVASVTGDAASNNNTTCIDVTIGAANQPNLEITELNLGSELGRYLPEAQGTLTYKIQNTGFAAIASGTAFTMNFTVDLVAVEEIGTHSITLSSILYPQCFITGTATFTMPTAAQLAADNGETELTFSDWGENLTATVDSGGVITETNEGDNTATVGLKSGSQKPDLEIASVEIAAGTDYAKAGNPVEYKVTVINDGYAAASGYSVILFVDINGTPGERDAGDEDLYTWSSPPTVPFDFVTGHNTVLLSVPSGTSYPSGITDGYYWVRAVITGSMEEWDTTNNTSDNGTSELVQFVTIAKDLSIDYMSTTLTDAVNEGAGGSIPVTFHICNSGQDAVETDFLVHLYASDDGFLNPAGDVDLGTVSVTSTVPGNGKIAVTDTLTFPGGQGFGFYTLYWVVDSGGVVTEYNETNNTVTDAEDCFVFFPVTDGSTPIASNLICYKPKNAPSEQTYIYGSYYNPTWSYNNSTSGWPTEPGERAFYFNCTLTPGNDMGVRLRGNNDVVYNGGVPYCFRFVPDYVYNLPFNALPNALATEDSFEENDGTGSAAELTGVNNPLVGFVNAWTFNYNYDYYYFTMP